MKNAMEPLVWKFYSFDGGMNFFSVDEYQNETCGPVLVKLGKRRDHELDFPEINGEIYIGQYIYDELPRSGNDDITENELPYHLIQRIDKLFGTNFKEDHESYIPDRNIREIKRHLKKFKDFYDVGVEDGICPEGDIDQAIESYLENL